MREVELYLHIPFCVRKCKYCDFKSFPVDSAVSGCAIADIGGMGGASAAVNRYLDALEREICACAERPLESMENIAVSSIYIGGGTPSVVEPGRIARLLDGIRECFPLAGDAEISMECNPGTVTPESLSIYRAAGVNRLSIGLQSANDAELRTLGRIHTWEQFLDAYRWAREAGFTNINVDVMGALPGQTVASGLETLERVLSLTPAPEHLSVYSLIIEEGTPFAAMAEAGELQLPDEDAERELHHRTVACLTEHGYEHYEISNFARPDCACRHNIGYWTRREYLGFGLAAASLWNGRRFRNTEDLNAYLTDSCDCRQEVETLTQDDAMAETMFLGLRMMRGVDLAAFAQRFGRTAEDIYGEVIRRHIDEGLLRYLPESENRRFLALTDRGIDVSNYVMADFLL